MDNLTLQVTPLELKHSAGNGSQLTCLFKKVALSTNYTLEKHQLSAYPPSTPGIHAFPPGPSFQLSRQFELNNTKIAMHFMAKHQRKFSCIGSTDIDLATIPNKSVSFVEYPVNTPGGDPGSVRVELRRHEARKHSKEPTSHKTGQPMGLLRTDGQVREEMLIKRRKQPEIPTAYEISRRNYKQNEIRRTQDDKTGNRSNGKRSNSKGSYHDKFSSTSRTRALKQQELPNEESPIPRGRTPQPIQTKTVKHVPGKFSSILVQEPSRPLVRAYDSEESSVVSREQWAGDRYGDLTSKLQAIQDRLLGPSRTEPSEAYQQQWSSALSQKTDPSIIQHQPLTQTLRSPDSHRSQEDVVEHPSSHMRAEQLVQPFSGRQEITDTERKGAKRQLTRQVGCQTEPTYDQHGNQAKQLEHYNQELQRQNQMQRAKVAESERTVQKLMLELQELKSQTGGQAEAQRLKERLQQSQNKAAQQQKMLSKMTQSYEAKVEELMELQEQLMELQAQLKQAPSASQPNEQTTRLEKRAVEAESALRLKDNHIRHLNLEMQNLKDEKQLLERELDVSARGNRNEIARQNSLARIQQISSSSLLQSTQRENKNLRGEVRILHQKVESLNRVFEQWLSSQTSAASQASQAKPSAKQDRKAVPQVDGKAEVNGKVGALEERCQELEGELRVKKNLMAEMVNLIWHHGNGKLMNNIEQLMGQ